MEERVWEEGHVNIQAAVCPSLIVISVAPSLLPVYIYSTSTNTNTNTNTLKMHKYNDQKTNCWLKKRNNHQWYHQLSSLPWRFPLTMAFEYHLQA